MKNVLALLLILLFVGMLKTQAKNRPLVFRNVTIIDVTGALLKPNMTVVISGGRIRDVAKTQDVGLPKNARVVDATGKFRFDALYGATPHAFASIE